MKQIIFTPKAPQPIGAYSQAVKYGSMLYISGQIPIDPETGKVVLDSAKKETRLVMDNIGEILRAAGMTFENVLRLLSCSRTSTISRRSTRYIPNTSSPKRHRPVWPIR